MIGTSLFRGARVKIARSKTAKFAGTSSSVSDLNKNGSAYNQQMKNMQHHYRQGDVLIERVVTLSNKPLQHQSPARILLAEGEATGHAHCLEAEKADWWKDGDTIGITVETPATVTHQEHAPITLPPGSYLVRRQREYSPEAIRNVAD